MADDLAELSRKMKLMRKQDESLLDIDDLTDQVSTARPMGGIARERSMGSVASGSIVTWPCTSAPRSISPTMRRRPLR